MTTNFAALNSATKYSSIETFHKLGPNGRLTEELNFTFEGDVHLREKIDGTNIRVIKMPGGDYVIGSREHLLHARGDRVLSPFEGVVEYLKPFIDQWPDLDDGTYLHVFYMEVYGGRIGKGARQYTSTGALGHRLFDVAFVPLSVLDWPIEQISAWRKGGGQKFADVLTLSRAASAHGLPLVPAVGTVMAEALPTTREGMYDWLRSTDLSNACLNGEGEGTSEGFVLRTPDRSVIAKARLADYRKVLGDMPSPKN